MLDLNKGSGIKIDFSHPDYYMVSKEGDYKFLQDKHRLTTDKIVEDILFHIK